MVTYPFRAAVVRVEQPLGVFYAAALPAELLLDVAFSDRMEAKVDSDGEGYTVTGTQREARLSRLAEIGRYIDRTDAAFPNSIILAPNYHREGNPDDEDAVQDPSEWYVEASGDRFTLVIPSKEKLVAVIDGQHRLFAYTQISRKERLHMELLCSIYLDLQKPYQAQLFATINSNQKPVSKSLTYELFGYNISDEPAKFWSPDKLAVFFARKLGTDSDSPMNGHISIAPKKDPVLEKLGDTAEWKVSTAVVVEGIQKLFSSNAKRDTEFLLTPEQKERSTLRGNFRDTSPLRDLYLENEDIVIYELAKNFLAACQEVFWQNAPTGTFIRKTVGYQALFDILRRKLAIEAVSAEDIRKEFFVDCLSPAGSIDFTGDKFKNASGSGRSIIRKAIEHELGLE